MKKRAAFFLISLILLTTIASAADVAYIYRKSFKIDNNIINVFKDLGLTVDLIQEESQPYNYNNYRFIFVGDENFKRNIPINSYPSIVASYYNTDTWGLTDHEGVSQLGATHPLSVLINSHQYQVYTQATIAGVAIPYYYLDQGNKAPNMQQVAATETTASGYKVGDVISYAPAGAQLMNGHTQQGKLCFYGITKSSYWTPKAKDLFKGCVNYVAAECSSDNDCPSPSTSAPFCQGSDVYETQTTYTCVNGLLANCEPHETISLLEDCAYDCANGACIGECTKDSDCDDQDINTEDICHEPTTPNSYCTNDPITCHNNEDCGIDGLIDGLFCTGNNITQNYQTWTCNLPGTAQSSCTSALTSQLIQICADVCIDGACEIIVCSTDADCDDSDIDTADTCHKPGQVDSYCTNDPITCHNNEDCGINGFTGSPTCSGLDIIQDYETFTCHSPNTPQSTCTSDVQPQILDTCQDACTNGQCQDITCHNNADCGDQNPLTLDECINPGTIISECRNTPINCNNNLDCGFIGFFGNQYCSLDNIMQNYQTAICNNPATLQSSCDLQVTQTLLNTCPFACLNGICIACDENTDCDDADPDTADICYNPATINSYCSNEDTTPQNIACTTNPDCGTSTAVSPLFCSLNNVNQLFLTWICNNPGTVQSYCSTQYQQQIMQTCPDICTNGQCTTTPCQNECTTGTQQCSGSGYVTCGNYDADSCTEWSSTVTPCTYGCTNGNCNPAPPQPPACTNDCTAGARQCSGVGYQVCGNYDTDSCLEWSPVTSCTYGCSAGTCNPQPPQQDPQCDDDLDNDGDKKVDYPADPQCSSRFDNDEAS